MTQSAVAAYASRGGPRGFIDCRIIGVGEGAMGRSPAGYRFANLSTIHVGWGGDLTRAGALFLFFHQAGIFFGSPRGEVSITSFFSQSVAASRNYTTIHSVLKKSVPLVLFFFRVGERWYERKVTDISRNSRYATTSRLRPACGA